MTLACPNCGSTSLATIEKLMGSAYGHIEADENGNREFIHEGWTECDWDSSESIGLECRECGWEVAGVDAGIAAVVVP